MAWHGTAWHGAARRTDGDVEDEVEGLVEGRGLGAALPRVARPLDLPELPALPEGRVELDLCCRGIRRFIVWVSCRAVPWGVE